MSTTNRPCTRGVASAAPAFRSLQIDGCANTARGSARSGTGCVPQAVGSEPAPKVRCAYRRYPGPLTRPLPRAADGLPASISTRTRRFRPFPATGAVRTDSALRGLNRRPRIQSPRSMPRLTSRRALGARLHVLLALSVRSVVHRRSVQELAGRLERRRSLAVAR
jgi:hypothetical protein